MLIRLPIAESLRRSRSASLTRDFSAGLAVAAVALPSAIAYPAIAGLPPETGLYSSIAPLVAYALVGPSRRLMLGPDAATMAVLGAALTSILAGTSAGDGADRVAIASILAVAVGCLCVAAFALRLGMIANFLSHPVLIGFLSGVSLSILVSQIGRFTGISIDAEGLIRPLIELVGKVASIHWPSLILGLSMFAILQAGRILRFPVPGAVVVVVLSVLLSWLFNFSAHGIAVVGDIPSGLPSIQLPAVTGLPLDTLLLGAFAVFIVSFGSGIVTARSFAARAGERIDPNKELVGFGVANAVTGFFSGFPVTASDSRTAINFSIGGSTQITGLVAAATLTATLLFLNGAIKILPLPSLGAILAAAALSLIDLNGLRRIWRVSRFEFAFALIAMWGAISLGVLKGVIIAVGATLLLMLSKEMFPRDAMLGRISGRDGFYKLHRSAEARPVQGLAIFLLQGSLLFFNVDHVQSRLLSVVDQLPSDTRWFILDASAIVQIDFTATVMLDDVCANLRRRGIAFGIAALHRDVMKILDRSGVLGTIGSEMVFDDLDDAIRAFDRSRSTPPSPASQIVNPQLI